MEKIKTTPIKKIRHIIQAAYFALSNGFLYGYRHGTIYRGSNKFYCFPGLNCYSCPGAFASCPIGSLQAILDGKTMSFSLYVMGVMMIFGSLLGRFICGWLCPFGLVQDLLYKIPFAKKMKNLPGHKVLKYLKYVIFIVFVIVLPSVVLNIAGTGQPWFCEYICPSGTLLGGIPLVILNKDLASAIGWRWFLKVGILLFCLLLAIAVYRPFCKYICPLGAFYGVFNPISFYNLRVDKTSCVECGACKKVCKMDIPVWKNPNNPECIRCGDCKAACPKGSITSSWEGKLIGFKKRNLMDDPMPNKEAPSAAHKVFGVIIALLTAVLIGRALWQVLPGQELMKSRGHSEIIGILSALIPVGLELVGAACVLLSGVHLYQGKSKALVFNLQKYALIFVILAALVKLLTLDAGSSYPYPVYIADAVLIGLAALMAKKA